MQRKLLASSLILFFAVLVTACNQVSSIDGPTYPLSPYDVRPVLVGTKAPAFNVHDAAGKPFSFDPDNLDAPALIIFYRGGWCPYCNKHLMKLRNIEQDMIDLGFDALFLSADKPEKLREMQTENEFSYTLLSDNDLIASTAFGLTYYVSDQLLEKLIGWEHDIEDASGRDHRLLPVPGVFLVNREGIIEYHYVNPDYKVRMEPSVILAAARVMVDQDEE